MALVDEIGREWYEVLDCEHPSEWVAKNVMPKLGKEATSLWTFQLSLRDFLSKYDSVHVIADWPEDIQHFCETLIIGSGKCIETPPLTMQIKRIDSESKLPHNALSDARANKEADV
jgi:hypothetical protein